MTIDMLLLCFGVMGNACFRIRHCIDCARPYAY